MTEPLLNVADTPIDPLCAVFFDLDGTLIDSLPDIACAANALRKDYHLDPLPLATIRSFIGDGVHSLAARTITGSWAFDFCDKTLHQLQRRFIIHYQRHLTDRTTCYRGAIETLKTLHKQGIALALISNKPERETQKLLAFFRLTPFFRIILGGDSLKEKKPHPLPLQETASRLGVPIEHTLMVGDSQNDMLAGKAAGSRTCLVDFGYGDTLSLCADTAKRPEYCIDHLPDLLKILK